ncbi:MAG TPA: D-aminoacyl-tRNA deacylase [Candidatus Polarisedimenticolaceae bacterium]|nr:D-aminoacyl-tRNA deacylase [Candidatus Polarisedimenticolaceae bacterium]
MKVLIQRVSRAAVRVAGREAGSIGRGALVFLGVERDDRPSDASSYARRAAELRIFPDEEGRMNRSVEEIGGAVLVVSQFTLAAATRRGRRPSFEGAAEPAVARELYEAFVAALRARGIPTESGVFGAMMEVELVNDGPVTILLDPKDEARA